jgi:hypothetical protein
MIEHRWEVQARVDGMTEGRVGGGVLELVTVCLFDGPDVVSAADGEPVVSAPVVCDLRPGEARELAFELLALAELAERRTLGG